eukprot:5966591-Pleurochrysis_carterae.AAC.1
MEAATRRCPLLAAGTRRLTPRPVLPQTPLALRQSQAPRQHERPSWLKCASEPTATLRGVVVSKCAAYKADCQRSIERFGRLPPTQGLNEVRRTARALQPGVKTNAKGVPTVACGLYTWDRQSRSKEARRLSACEGASGLALSAVRRGTDSRTLASRALVVKY